MLYFKNPPKKKGKGGKPKKRRTAKQKAATAKLVKLNKAKGKKKTAPKKKSTRKVAKKKSAKKKVTKKTTRKSTKKKGARKVAKKRKSTRRKSTGNISLKRISGKVYRANPPALIKAGVQGLKDAAYVKVGGIAGNMVAGMVPVSGLGSTAVKAGVAVGLGFLPIPGDGRRFIIAGAMAGVLDDLLVMAGLGKFAGSGVSSYLPSDGGVSAYLSGDGGEGEDVYSQDAAVGAYVSY